jgi:hypothetical protein
MVYIFINYIMCNYSNMFDNVLISLPHRDMQPTFQIYQLAYKLERYNTQPM